MCTFVTLIAATNDLLRINALLKSSDSIGCHRRAERIDTVGLRSCLEPDEREFWLNRSPCDCGSFLGSSLRRDIDPVATRSADFERYRRKGWSEKRILRAFADRDKAATRRAQRVQNEDAMYWVDLLASLGAGLGLRKIGLMHHFYRTQPGSEPETATREMAGNLWESHNLLAYMADGVIYDFFIK